MFDFGSIFVLMLYFMPLELSLPKLRLKSSV